jgi:hypothetical protein
MSTILNKLTFTAVQNILAKRKIIRLSDDKSLVKVHIQSGGNIIAVTTKDGTPVIGNGGIPLMKAIYNVAANSHVAMLNPRNQEILRGAHEAEQQGDDDTAHAAYNDYLNKIQVSFNVMINPGSAMPKFGKNDLIKGTVQLITTDNGQLLTLDKVGMVEATELRDTAKLSLADLLGLTDAPTAEDVFTPIEGVDAATTADAETEARAGE